MGVNVQKLILLVFLIAGSLAGLAGALLGAKYTAFPTLGTAMTNKAFISSVFGGLGSIPGAVLGAIILGIGETLISSYISSSMRDIFAYALLVIVLFVRPSGLWARPRKTRHKGGVEMNYWMGVATLTGIYMIAILGVSILTGFTGLFSMGHAGFMAIGAYTSALIIKDLPRSDPGGRCSAACLRPWPSGSSSATPRSS